MDQRITDSLKALFSAQHVTVTGDSIAEVLTDGFTKLNNATISSDRISGIIQNCVDTGTFSGGGLTELTWDGPEFVLTSSKPTDWDTKYYEYFTEDEDTGIYNSVPPVEEGQPVPEWTADTYYKLDEEFVSIYSSEMPGYWFLIKASDDVMDSSYELATLMLSEGAAPMPVPASIAVDSDSTQLIYYGMLSAAVSVNSDNQTVSISNVGTPGEVVFPKKGTYLLYMAGSGMVWCIDGFSLIMAETASWNEDNTVTIPEYSHMSQVRLSNTGDDDGEMMSRLSEDALFSTDYDGYYLFDAEDTNHLVSLPAWDYDFYNIVIEDLYSDFKYDGKPYLALVSDGNNPRSSYLHALVTTENDTNIGTVNYEDYDTIEKRGTYIRYFGEHDFTYIERIPSSVAFSPIVCTPEMFDDSNKVELADGYYAYKISDNFIPIHDPDGLMGSGHATYPSIHVHRENTEVNSNWNGLIRCSSGNGNIVTYIGLSINMANPVTFFITANSDNASITLAGYDATTVTFTIPEKGTYIGALAAGLGDVTNIKKVVVTNLLNRHTSFEISEDPGISFGSGANEYILLDSEGYQLLLTTQQTYNVSLDGVTYSNLPTSGITRTLVDMNTEMMSLPVTDGITLNLLLVRDYRFTKDNIVFKPKLLGTYMLKSEAEAYNYHIEVTSA